MGLNVPHHALTVFWIATLLPSIAEAGNSLRFKLPETKERAKQWTCATDQMDLLSEGVDFLTGSPSDPSPHFAAAVQELYPGRHLDTEALGKLAQLGIVGTSTFRDLLEASAVAEAPADGILSQDALRANPASWVASQTPEVRERIARRVAAGILRGLGDVTLWNSDSRTLGRRLQAWSKKHGSSEEETGLFAALLLNYQNGPLTRLEDDLVNLFVSKPQLIVEHTKKPTRAPSRAVARLAREAVIPKTQPLPSGSLRVRARALLASLKDQNSLEREHLLLRNLDQLDAEGVIDALKSNPGLSPYAISRLTDWKLLLDYQEEMRLRTYRLEAREYHLRRLLLERNRALGEASPWIQVGPESKTGFLIADDADVNSLDRKIRDYFEAIGGSMSEGEFTHVQVPQILNELYALKARRKELPPEVFMRAVQALALESARVPGELSSEARAEIIGRTIAILKIKPKFRWDNRYMGVYQRLLGNLDDPTIITQMDKLCVAGAAAGTCAGYMIMHATGNSFGVPAGLIGGLASPMILPLGHVAYNGYRYAKVQMSYLEAAFKRQKQVLAKKPWGTNADDLGDSFTDADELAKKYQQVVEESKKQREKLADANERVRNRESLPPSIDEMEN